MSKNSDKREAFLNTVSEMQSTGNLIGALTVIDNVGPTLTFDSVHWMTAVRRHTWRIKQNRINHDKMVSYFISDCCRAVHK